MSTELPDATDAGDDGTRDDHDFLDEDGVLYDDEVTPEHGILGFTLRELLIVGVWLVAFIVSFFPLTAGAAIWGSGIQWILPIGAPTVAVFLLVLRRFSPDGIRRVGSLGIDQFASVTFSVSAVFWAGALWNAFAVLIELGVFGISWVAVVLLVASLALVVLTVFAPIVPGLKEDFQGRLVTLAHRNANPVRPVIARPRPEPSTASEPAAAPAAQEPAAAPVTEASLGGVPFAEAPPAASPFPAEPVAPSPFPGQSVAPASASREAFSRPASDETNALPIVEAQDAPTPSLFERPAELDVELSGQQATDEVARLDLATQVPLSAHASGGDTGTEDATADEAYVPPYSRRSRGQEIVSDTGSIEQLLGTARGIEHEDAVAQDANEHDDAIEYPSAQDHAEPGQFTGSGQFTDETASEAPTDSYDDVEVTNPREAVNPSQPFWVLAATERDVHDERGEPLFRIGPSAWALVIEDRGGAYVVRHDDGRIGYLHDISDTTKG